MFNKLLSLFHLYSLDLDCFCKVASVTAKDTDKICFFHWVPFQCCNYTMFCMTTTSISFPSKDFPNEIRHLLGGTCSLMMTLNISLFHTVGKDTDVLSIHQYPHCTAASSIKKNHLEITLRCSIPAWNTNSLITINRGVCKEYWVFIYGKTEGNSSVHVEITEDHL